jgi:hypothetical protein
MNNKRKEAAPSNPALMLAGADLSYVMTAPKEALSAARC